MALSDLITPELQETLDKWRAACDLASADINKLDELLRKSPTPAFLAEEVGIAWFKKQLCRAEDGKPLAELPLGDRMELFRRLPRFLELLGLHVKLLSDMTGIPDKTIADRLVGQKLSDQLIGQEEAPAPEPVAIKPSGSPSVIRRPGGGMPRPIKALTPTQEDSLGDR